MPAHGHVDTADDVKRMSLGVASTVFSSKELESSPCLLQEAHRDCRGLREPMESC